MSTAWPGKRELLVVVALLCVFVAIRLPGLSLPYHQDEWKTAEIVRSQIVGGLAAHPPLTELIYRWNGYLISADHLRLVPLVFATISAILLYLVVRRRAGSSAARASLALYAVCAYGVYASLMIDTDGAILPALFLLTVYTYDRFRDAASSRASFLWAGAIAAALLLGLLVKLSFVLVLGALMVDYLIKMRSRLTRALLIRIVFAAITLLIIALAAAASARIFSLTFNAGKILEHALLYVRFEGRGYLQILVQGAKAVFYLSPLILMPLMFISKSTLVKNRIFAIYLGIGAIFYFVLFDFSQAALDKYLMFSIVPLCALAGTILADLLRDVPRRSIAVGAGIGFLGALLLISVNFLSPSVIPLYPKTAWIRAVAAGNWNILMPFTGGSGPLGFYASFLFIAAGFALASAFAAVGRAVPRLRSGMLVALIVIGAAFNAVFIEELMFGRINGSAPAALRASLTYIADEGLTEVITHADTGAYELSGMGKYAGRFYAVPGYEEGHKALFSKFNGYYLVVDMPHINEDSFYGRFFATCDTVFTTVSGVIAAHVYYCPASNPYSIN